MARYGKLWQGMARYGKKKRKEGTEKGKRGK